MNKASPRLVLISLALILFSSLPSSASASSFWFEGTFKWIGNFLFASATSSAWAPTFSPPAGTYSTTQTVAVTSATSGTTICYTTDNSTPTANGSGTCTHGTSISNGGTVSVSSSETIEAIASEAGYADSGVASAAYTISLMAQPGFVSETSKNSTLTNAVTTEVSGTVTCGNYSYCLPYADPVLAGNLGIISFQYDHASTAVTATVTDDKSDSYTCTAAVEVGVTGYWVESCYAANLTAGARAVKITFGTTAVTEVMAKAASFYNVATSNPLDASNACSGASSSTAGGCPITTAAANDLVYVYVARVGNPAVTSFTPGSGYTLGTTDINDGGATEYRVVSGTGTTTPSMAMASVSTYGIVVTAFKAATAGTVPTGWYLDRLMSWSTPESYTGNVAYQFPSSGNLQVVTNSCNTIVPGSVVDANRTWASTGSAIAEADNNISEDYSTSSSADGTGLVTVDTSGSDGDCTQFFYDFSGAPTSSLVVSRASYQDYFSPGASLAFSTGTETWYAGGLLYNGTTAFGQIGTFLPMPTYGLAIAVGSQDLNTTLSISSPSECMGDMATQGGENRDGPWPVDQNNPFGHCWLSGSPAAPLAWPQGSSSTNPTDIGGDIIGIFGSAGVGIVDANYIQQTSASFLSGSIAATTAGNLFVVNAGVYNSTARTITAVCLNGNSTCSTGTQLTELPGSVSTGSGHGATSIWYTLSAPSGATTLDIVASASAANIEGAYYEVQKGSGGSWATDGTNETSNGTGSGTTITGPSVTTAGAADFCSGNVGVSDGVIAVPLGGNEFTYGDTIFNNTLDSAASLLTTTAGAHAPAWTDRTSGDSFSASTACFK